MKINRRIYAVFIVSFCAFLKIILKIFSQIYIPLNAEKKDLDITKNLFDIISETTKKKKSPFGDFDKSFDTF